MKDAAKISVWLLQRDFYGLTERFYWRWWWGGFLVFSYWISWDEPKIVWASKLWIPNTIIFREKLLSKQQKKLQHNFNFDKFVSGLGWLSVGFLKLIFWLLLYFVSGYNWNAFSSIQNWWVSWLELRTKTLLDQHCEDSNKLEEQSSFISNKLISLYLCEDHVEVITSNVVPQSPPLTR